MSRAALTDVRGFSVTELLLTCAIIAVAAAVAMPQMASGLDQMRLGMSVRDVASELQFARLKAVAIQQPMRIRFNCPAAGQIRVVEVIGTAANPDPKDLDSYTDRCSETLFPYRPTGGDQSRLTRPNNDGPIRRLQSGAAFTASQTLEFWANGSVHVPSQACCTAGAQIDTVTLTLSRNGKTKNITVNGLGKILADR